MRYKATDFSNEGLAKVERRYSQGTLMQQARGYGYSTAGLYGLFMAKPNGERLQERLLNTIAQLHSG